MKVSAEIAVMIEREEERLRKQEQDREATKRWNEKVGRAVDLLNQCAVADDAPASKVVLERWVPAAVAAVACVPARRIKAIDLPAKSMRLLFHRLLDDPDSKKVQESVLVDLREVLARIHVPREDLFYLFRVLVGYFETLLSYRASCIWPQSLEGDAQEVPAELEADPGVQEIRTRLVDNPVGVEKVLRVYVELCRDRRDVIPRAALKKMGLAPTAVDRAPRSAADVTDNPRRFKKAFLLKYVRSTWRPRKSKAKRVAKTHVPSTSTANS